MKRQRKDAKAIHSRDSSFNYFFNVSGEEKMVCQRFFLNTLGFKSHKVLLTVASKSQGKVLSSPDKRGKSSLTNRLSDEERKNIQAHIMSYSPSCSHYRRVHAPNRVYLSPQLSVAGMYRNYTQDGGKASYQTYRKEVTLKNISFAQLGQEECEVCIQYGEHNCSKQDETNCELCDLYEGHKARSIEARKLYQEDSSKESNEEAFFSVDLEKVIMLPRMPGVKTVVFTRWIVAYNETFAPLGDKKSKRKTTKPVAMTWQEGEGKRSSQEICTAYIKFLNNGTNRDIKNFTFWVDNCSAQNKCWWLFIDLCDAVNNERNMDLQSVTLTYFEKGHSSMSATAIIV